jgi:hypothetical protein
MNTPFDVGQTVLVAYQRDPYYVEKRLPLDKPWSGVVEAISGDGSWLFVREPGLFNNRGWVVKEQCRLILTKPKKPTVYDTEET